MHSLKFPILCGGGVGGGGGVKEKVSLNSPLIVCFFHFLFKMIDLAKQGDEETINSWITVSVHVAW